MKTKQGLLGAIVLVAVYFLSVSFINVEQDKKWVAPKSADAIVNPLEDDASVAAFGKRLYRAMCAVCHGVKGKGDGMAGAGLNPKPTNFTTEVFQSQTDGAIFWKIEEGRSPMASYKTSIPENKRWQIVNYLRTLKK